MNCRRCQHRIYEYLDGTLSARVQAAADKHLAACGACRDAVRRQQQLAESLSAGLRLATEPLRLSPDVRRRVLACRDEKPFASDEGRFLVLLWRRWTWPLSVAAAVMVAGGLLAFVFPRDWRSRTESAGAQAQRTEGAVWIQVSYVAPAYTFRKAGDRVIDVLSCQTNFVNEWLWADQGSKPVSKQQERESTL
jgi:anti-sigma factor RsiW